MPPPLDLAVILVTWNVRALALDALHSLYADLAQSGLAARVIVVDSASNDGTAEAVRAAFPQADVIALEYNIGFGAANNVGLAHLAEAAPNAIYLLNPDTLTPPGATRALYDALFADAHTGLVGARLTYADGQFQHSAFTFPGLRQLWAELFPTPGRWIEGRFNGRYPRSSYTDKTPFPVDFVLGATMMLRREVVEATSGFNEAFFLYCEEIEWAWRIRRAGWQVLCVPGAHVVHLGGQSTGQVRPRSVLQLWESRLALYARIHPRWKFMLACGLIALGMRRRQARADATLAAAYGQVSQMALANLRGALRSGNTIPHSPHNSAVTPGKPAS